MPRACRDMDTLNKAVSLYYSDAMNNPSTMFMGTSSVIYVSIPDPAATSTAGDQCQGLGLPAAPTGYTYQCATSSTYTKDQWHRMDPDQFHFIFRRVGYLKTSRRSHEHYIHQSLLHL